MSFTSSRTVALNKAGSFVLPLAFSFPLAFPARSPSFFWVGESPVAALPTAFALVMELEREVDSRLCLDGEILKLRTEPWRELDWEWEWVRFVRAGGKGRNSVEVTGAMGVWVFSGKW